MRTTRIFTLCMFAGILLALGALPVASASPAESGGYCRGPVDAFCADPIDTTYCWLFVGDEDTPYVCVTEDPPTPNLADDVCELLPPHVCGP